AGCIEPPANGAIAEVVVDALEAMRPYFLTGLPNLGVPPLDPMGPLPSLSFHVNNEAIVLDGSVNDTMVRNLAQFIICQVNISVGLKPKFYIEFRLDNFHMDGLYDVDGLAVSLFPIFGNGNYT
ncbi:hemolymph juvenile hormone binding, partial [Trinorchestia longiramus]